MNEERKPQRIRKQDCRIDWAHYPAEDENGNRQGVTYMKAAILNGYNKNGCDLVINDIPAPEFSSQEVLVKILLIT